MSNIKAISGSSRIINRPSGGGNKLQGIPSSSNINTTSHIAFNIRGTGNTYNRNLVFCINQLSGVGKNKSQFNSSADGVNCNYCKNLYIQEYTNKYIYDINKFFKEQLCNLLNGKYNAYKKYNNIDNFTLCYVGDKETFINDITYNSKHTKNIINSTNFNLQNKIFSHLTNNIKSILINLFVDEYNTILINIPIPNYIYQKIMFINNKLKTDLPYYFTNKQINRYGIHTLGIIHNFQIKTINNSYVSVKSLLNKDHYGTGTLINELSIYASGNSMSYSKNIVFSPGGLKAFTSNSAIIYNLLDMGLLNIDTPYRFIGGSGGAWTIHYGLNANSSNKLSIFSQSDVDTIIQNVYSKKKSTTGFSITTPIRDAFENFMPVSSWFFDYNFNWQDIVNDVIDITIPNTSKYNLNINNNEIFITGTISKTTSQPPISNIDSIDTDLYKTDGLYSFYGYFNYSSWFYNKNNLPIIFQYDENKQYKIQSPNYINETSIQTKVVENVNEVMALSSGALGFITADTNISMTKNPTNYLKITALYELLNSGGYDVKNVMPIITTSDNIQFYGMDGGNSDYNGFWSLLNTSEFPQSEEIHITRATWCSESNPKDYLDNLLSPSMLNQNNETFLTSNDGISPGFLNKPNTTPIYTTGTYLHVYQITGMTSSQLNYNRNRSICIDLIICSISGIDIQDLPLSSDTAPYTQFYTRITNELNNAKSSLSSLS